MERFAMIIVKTIDILIDHTKTAVEKFATISVQALKKIKNVNVTRLIHTV